eukprot:TRINITY_DN13399_c0_g1_i1.p1 TRINITY_DN13399_c0_g1~~TRINITY_DN13399_c0_g1_i1.p1  ORF type:complete len:288 (+),score=43.33 TRINITY_DN13399_c0_g1_i1:1-864(+)
MMEGLGDFALLSQIEILKEIFFYCDISSQINFSMTCKRMRSLPGIEQCWKKKSKELWTQIVELPFSLLEEALEIIPSIKWKHIVLHLSNPNSTGSSYSAISTRDISIGQFHRDKNNQRVRKGKHLWLTDYIRFGDFTSKEIGEAIRKTSQHFLRVQIRSGEFFGQGEMITTSGVRYVGEFKDWLWNGTGTVSFPDGFSFSTKWEEGQPIKPPLHPKVEECLKRNVCTRTIGGDYVFPQKINVYRLGRNRYSVCQVCQGSRQINPLEWDWSTSWSFTHKCRYANPKLE